MISRVICRSIRTCLDCLSHNCWFVEYGDRSLCIERVDLAGTPTRLIGPLNYRLCRTTTTTTTTTEFPFEARLVEVEAAEELDWGSGELVCFVFLCVFVAHVLLALGKLCWRRRTECPPCGNMSLHVPERWREASRSPPRDRPNHRGRRERTPESTSEEETELEEWPAVPPPQPIPNPLVHGPNGNGDAVPEEARRTGRNQGERERRPPSLNIRSRPRRNRGEVERYENIVWTKRQG